jgi:endonuclease YncB( thermonuclease family)
MPAMKTRVWFYHDVDITRVIDGDTFDARVLLTPTIATHIRVRIRGLWAAELKDPDPAKRHRAVIAREMLDKLLLSGDVELAFHGQDMYGRWICDVSTNETADVAAAMIEFGVADPKRTNHVRHEIETPFSGTTEISTRTFDEYEEQH